MIQFYTPICLVFVLFANAQVINFPDANFKAKLLEPESAYLMNQEWVSADINDDGEIDMIEAANVFALDVSDGNISDLTGISNFVNLKSLRCQNNLLTNITINHSIEMWSINASHNQLNSINVNFVTGDQEYDPLIDLSFNNLTTFSLSNCIVWGGLYLNNNQLTTLNINNCSIFYFFVGGNNLTSINFTGDNFIGGTASFFSNPFNGLYFYNVGFDNETNFIFGNHTKDELYFAQSQPGNLLYSSTNTSCDFGNFSRVTNCDPYQTGHITISNCPNLENTVLKNGFNHTVVTCEEGGDVFDIPALWLTINGAPNLSHICVDAPEEPTVQFWVDNAGLQNQINVDSNCPMSTLDVEEVITGRFTVFPIPVTDVLQIQSKENPNITSIEIYNNLGQLVKNDIDDKQSIDVSSFPNGIYYLKIESNNLTDTKKNLKQ